MRTLLFGVAILAAAIVSLATVAADTATAPKEPGDLWEVTMTMSMQGMNMPMPPQKVCSPREWTKPPMKADDKSNCEPVDFKTTANKSSWKLKCAGPPPMTGEGEITRHGRESYEGWMKMTSEQGVVNMTMTGKRLGDCDYAEQRAKNEAIVAQAQAGQKMAADAMKQSCMAPVESLDLRSLNMMASMCTDPEVKTAFCKKVDTADGFKMLCERGENDPPNGLTAIAAYCARDAGELRKSFCKVASEKEDLDLIGKCCPEQAQAIAAKECAGRDYTSLMGTKYANFCVMYARGALSGDNAKPAEEKKEEGKTKKLLKGIFKR